MYVQNAVSNAVLSALYGLIVTGAMVERTPAPANVAAMGFPTLLAVDAACITCGGILTFMKGHILAEGVNLAFGRGSTPEEAYLNWRLSNGEGT